MRTGEIRRIYETSLAGNGAMLATGKLGGAVSEEQGFECARPCALNARAAVKAEVGSPPYIRMEDTLTWWTLGATIGIEAGPSWQLGLSAILEEHDGTKSYWALAHAPGKPDFSLPVTRGVMHVKANQVVVFLDV